MEKAIQNQAGNPLATEKVGKLLARFAIPSVIGMLVSALYNIVDQIFIGQGVGMLGNAATNVSFPLTTVCVSIALLLGIGGASNFSLALGAGNKEKAGNVAGNAMTLMVIFGVALFAVVQIFLEPMMRAFGSSELVLPYALEYTHITSIGMPFLILANGASQLIRADGSPLYSMVCMLVGAGINTVLDPIFIFVFDMGIAGAAWATIISQIVSCVIALLYFRKFKNLRMQRQYFRLRAQYIKLIISLGIAAFFNQVAMMAVQIVMNNTLTHYGALSDYGSEIPLAVVGIITKVAIVMMSFVIGIAQGNQPIVGFNYGAKNYGRVRESYIKAVLAATVVSTIGFLCFQLFPRQIISIFGEGSELYFHFAERYFRIYMLLAFAIGLQPVTSNFFTAIGKAKLGILISLTRQVLFLLPLIILFPMFMGIDGVMYAGPISDCAAVIVALALGLREMKRLKIAEQEMSLQRGKEAPQTVESG